MRAPDEAATVGRALDAAAGVGPGVGLIFAGCCARGVEPLLTAPAPKPRARRSAATMLRLTSYIRGISVRRKLLLLTLLTTSIALFFAATIYTIYQLSALRHELMRDVAALADGIAERGRLAILDDDRRSLESAFTALSGQRHISSALVYAKDGTLFAVYRRDARPEDFDFYTRGAALPPAPSGSVLIRPVLANGENIGSVYVSADMTRFYRHLTEQGIVAAGVMLASFFIAFLLTNRVRREITEPIQNLTDTAKAASQKRLSEPPETGERKDELGLLVRAFHGLLDEVHEREAALRSSEQRFRTLIERSSDLVTIIDQDGRIRYQSPSSDLVLGFSPAMLVDTNWFDLVHHEDVEDVREALQRGMEQPGVPISIELRCRHQNGSWRNLEAVGTNQLAEPAVSGIVINAHDITDRIRAAAELSDAKEAAESADLAKSHFLANVSHEIRTPVTAMLGMTELLQRTTLKSDQQSYVETVRSSGNTLLSVVDDILALSWATSGEVALDSLDFDLHVLVENMVEIMAQRAESKGIELCVMVEPDVPRAVRGDPKQLRQVLINLIGNAVKFTDRGEIEIGVAITERDSHDGLFRFTIRDTGIGIPEPIRTQLFAPFVQADASYGGRRGGTGVGLSISRRLVSMMKGEIGFDSDFGAGTCFWFSARLEERAPDLGEAAPVTALARHRTLIAVANSTVRRHLLQQTMILGLDSKGAPCGSDAMEMLRRASAEGEPFDIAFVDYGLPDVNGLALIRAIRADPRVADTCLVMLASLGELMDAEGLQAEGIDLQLTKPIKQTQLAERLTQALRTSERSAPQLAGATDAPGQDEVNGAAAPHKARVLLAEDDGAIRKALSLMMGVMGYDVVAVENGAKALEAYETDHYDLILIDCQMPKMDGWEVSTRIRRGEVAGLHVPIIGITGYVLESERERCLAAGMDECLTKPVPMEKLSFILEHHLAASLVVSGRLHE